MSINASRALLYSALTIVAITVIWGFCLVGSPSFNRKLTADLNRISNLERLSTDIDRYFDEQKTLPENLADLDKLKSWYGTERQLEDPVTKRKYEYNKNDAFTYELCAEFDLNSEAARIEQRTRYAARVSWKYEAGRHCFSFNIPEAKRNSK